MAKVSQVGQIDLSSNKKFPKEEVFGLVSQMRRSAVSIPSNIAEGRSRGSLKDFTQFLRIAHGSGSELETQLYLSFELSFVSKQDYEETTYLLSEVMRMLNAMISKLAVKR